MSHNTWFSLTILHIFQTVFKRDSTATASPFIQTGTYIAYETGALSSHTTSTNPELLADTPIVET